MRPCLLALLVTVVASSAAAQAGAREEALARFRISQEHYNAGRFDEAARLLEEAYAIHPEPILLYNAARAHEGAGRFDAAVAAYERYLAEAGAIEDRLAIESRVATLRERVRRERELLDRATRPPPPETAIEPWPWIALGTGIAALGAGIGLGVIAQGRHDAAVVEPVHERAAALEREAYDYATGANVTMVVGGTVALIGAVWGVLALVLDAPRSANGRAELRF